MTKKISERDREYSKMQSMHFKSVTIDDYEYPTFTRIDLMRNVSDLIKRFDGNVSSLCRNAQITPNLYYKVLEKIDTNQRLSARSLSRLYNVLRVEVERIYINPQDEFDIVAQTHTLLDAFNSDVNPFGGFNVGALYSLFDGVSRSSMNSIYDRDAVHPNIHIVQSMHNKLVDMVAVRIKEQVQRNERIESIGRSYDVYSNNI